MNELKLLSTLFTYLNVCTTNTIVTFNETITKMTLIHFSIFFTFFSQNKLQIFYFLFFSCHKNIWIACALTCVKTLTDGIFADQFPSAFFIILNFLGIEFETHSKTENVFVLSFSFELSKSAVALEENSFFSSF